MNRLPPSPDDFDRSLRQLQQHADATLSPATLSRLRQARRQAVAATSMRRRGWWLATACSAVLATTLALGFHQRSAPEVAPVAGVADEAGIDDDTLLFDESPELYLWLGSDGTLAME